MMEHGRWSMELRQQQLNPFGQPCASSRDLLSLVPPSLYFVFCHCAVVVRFLTGTDSHRCNIPLTRSPWLSDKRVAAFVSWLPPFWLPYALGISFRTRFEIVSFLCCVFYFWILSIPRLGLVWGDLVCVCVCVRSLFQGLTLWSEWRNVRVSGSGWNWGWVIAGVEISTKLLAVSRWWRFGRGQGYEAEIWEFRCPNCGVLEEKGTQRSACFFFFPSFRVWFLVRVFDYLIGL